MPWRGVSLADRTFQVCSNINLGTFVPKFGLTGLYKYGRKAAMLENRFRSVSHEQQQLETCKYCANVYRTNNSTDYVLTMTV